MSVAMSEVDAKVVVYHDHEFESGDKMIRKKKNDFELSHIRICLCLFRITPRT